MAFLQADVPFSAVALTGTTARTVVGVKAATNQAVKIVGIKLSFDGSTSTATPVLVEMARCTFATNGPGTASTSATPVKRDSGRGETIQATAATAWTSEPTVITVAEAQYVGAYNGLYDMPISWDRPFILPGGQGFVLRLTAPANVNASGTLIFEE